MTDPEPVPFEPNDAKCVEMIIHLAQDFGEGATAALHLADVIQNPLGDASHAQILFRQAVADIVLSASCLVDSNAIPSPGDQFSIKENDFVECPDRDGLVSSLRQTAKLLLSSQVPCFSAAGYGLLRIQPGQALTNGARITKQMEFVCTQLSLLQSWGILRAAAHQKG